MVASNMTTERKSWKSRLALLIVIVALLFFLIPAGIFAAIFLTSPMNPLNSWLFNRQLPEYDRAVADIKAGKIPTSQTVEMIDVSKFGYSVGRAAKIYAAHCNNGTVTVAFLVSGSAVGHWGYVFDDCNVPSISLTHDNTWFKHASIVPIEGNWYQFSN